ncbi:hypothetical protein C5167_020097 [Papaver somniferum]|uniref:Uncharacterized protein n=2 Tax=Papaver somniferum TaxID=3469 RepID=A0A4Y7IVD2_PAPSO|nr:hypothetical protein C5167_020097 [Papaver somniferum]
MDHLFNLVFILRGFSLQITVGWGIAIVVPGVWPDPDEYGVDKRSLLISRIIFYMGLHETMLHWASIVIRPIVDCKIFGGSRSEKWIEKAAISSGFGALWWWSLKDKVDTLALAVEIKRELLIGWGISDFINWWLYYLTVTVGVLRVVKCFIWFAKGLLFYRRPQDSNNGSCEDDNKVLHHPLLPVQSI